MSRTRKWHELHDDEYFREYRKSVDTAAVLADLPELYSASKGGSSPKGPMGIAPLNSFIIESIPFSPFPET